MKIYLALGAVLLMNAAMAYYSVLISSDGELKEWAYTCEDRKDFILRETWEKYIDEACWNPEDPSVKNECFEYLTNCQKVIQ